MRLQKNSRTSLPLSSCDGCEATHRTGGRASGQRRDRPSLVVRRRSRGGVSSRMSRGAARISFWTLVWGRGPAHVTPCTAALDRPGNVIFIASVGECANVCRSLHIRHHTRVGVSEGPPASISASPPTLVARRFCGCPEPGVAVYPGAQILQSRGGLRARATGD